MKTFYLLFFISLLACENKQTKVNYTTTKNKTKTTKESIKKDSINAPKREFPLLTDANAMAFFETYGKTNTEQNVRITTDFGNIDIKLYNQTKYHRANFIFLVKQGYFTGTQFYRIVNNFIIQGGNSDDRAISKRRVNIGKYLLPKDTRHGFKHYRGVLSIPSSEIENPYKLASPYEFFIVQQKGGAHHLNDDYTVFGKVIKGMNVVDKIAAQPTDNGEWPLQNVYIRSVEILD